MAMVAAICRRSSAARAARPAPCQRNRSAPDRQWSFSRTSSPAMARPACRAARWCRSQTPELSGCTRCRAASILFELFRHPVGALRAPAIGAVGRDVVAILDHHQLDRPFRLAREALGVLGWHDAVEPSIHNEERTGDVLRNAFKR